MQATEKSDELNRTEHQCPRKQVLRVGPLHCLYVAIVGYTQTVAIPIERTNTQYSFSSTLAQGRDMAQ